MTELLAVSGLHVDYPGVRAVHDVSFTLRQGEVFGLVGESGSGKSSVCAALTRVLPPGARMTAEAVRLDGQALSDLTDEQMRRLRATRIGVIPQRPMTSLSPVTPVLRQLRWHAGDADLPALLGQVGLRAVLDRPRDAPHRFSGGQLQRLLILLAALARQPDLLIADEPTTTLDPTVQAQVLRLLLDLRDRLRLAILYVTHDLAVVAQVCDRVGVMYGGRLVETGTTEQIFTSPRHPYTRALLSALPGRTGAGSRLGALAPGPVARHGCPFAPRCPVVMDVCAAQDPQPVLDVRCHHTKGTP
ncbi:ABC transporter ATP-binding protein [Nonomuraea spiralis]|uniref:ABC transporter ATP-binding protein n=1 Tax=Nonomuraea spiralis TaxID=46182 RepID=A0ABV5IT12_9ACTN|nr:ABC transporter ATP-binding protein [Nonomuraea spiralis]GGT16839.1 ABC transporter ATP-binding protein [Nonomuraea spiralis]